MRILLTHRPGGAYGFISEGWLNALLAGGHVAQRWDGQIQTWESFDPDLYIGCSGHRQPIPQNHGKAKIAIHVNPYSDVNVDGINEAKAAIDWTLAQNPTVVFGYGHDTDRQLWEHWTSRHGIPWVPLPTAGDSTIYKIIESGKSIDIGYVGGYWPYKARNLDRYLLPVVRDKSLRMSVFGWGDWPAGICRGGIDDSDVPAVLASARVGPCVVEPHTTKWGIDLPERLWKVALCGALVVHDPVHGLGRYMPSALVATDPADFHHLCKHYADESHESERIALAQRQRAEVLAKHTYFQRMATLFIAISDATDCSSSFGSEALKLSLLQ